MNNAPLTVSEFINITNDLLACNFETVLITGEVASFKVNQGKWVFLILKTKRRACRVLCRCGN